jgi:hypothetical protein
MAASRPIEKPKAPKKKAVRNDTAFLFTLH